MITTTVDKQWNGADVKIRGKKVIGKTAFEVGLVVQGQAKLLCPVNWGYLAASITTQSRTIGTEPDTPVPGPNPKGPNVTPGNMKITPPTDDMEVLVGTPVEYGPWNEFGTYRMDAQPFLRPALEMAKGSVLTLTQINSKWYFKDYLT